MTYDQAARRASERNPYQAQDAAAAYEFGIQALVEELLGREPLPSVMFEALDITREAVAAQVESEAIALLRELNDALKIPGWLQPPRGCGVGSSRG